MIPIIGPALSALSAAVSALGPAFSHFVGNVLPRLLPYLEKGLDILQNVARVAELLSQGLGVLKPGETLREIGGKALQASGDGITADRYDTHAQYREALRAYTLDPQMRSAPVLELMAGLAVVSAGLEEKFDVPEGSVGEIWPLVAADGAYFTQDKLLQLLNTGHELYAFIDYFNGRIGGAESLRAENALTELDRQWHPDRDEAALRAAVQAVQERVAAAQSAY